MLAINVSISNLIVGGISTYRRILATCDKGSDMSGLHNEQQNVSNGSSSVHAIRCIHYSVHLPTNFTDFPSAKFHKI